MRIVTVLSALFFSLPLAHSYTELAPYLITEDIFVTSRSGGESRRVRLKTSDGILLKLQGQTPVGQYRELPVTVHFSDGRPSLQAVIDQRDFGRATVPYSPVRIAEEISVSVNPPSCCPLDVPEDERPSIDDLLRPQYLQIEAFAIPAPDESSGNYLKSFYEKLRETADRHRGNRRRCTNRLNQLYREHSVWKDLNHSQRATLVLAIIRREIHRLRERDDAHSALAEAPLACIVKRENPEFVPEKVNYSFCQSYRNKYGRPRSAAHGLGQITSSTFYGYHQLGIFGEPLPEYIEDEKFKSQNFYALGSRPVLQIRLLALHMNALLKSEESLEAAIGEYDRDLQGPYLKDVRSCMGCMQEHESSDQIKIERCLTAQGSYL